MSAQVVALVKTDDGRLAAADRYAREQLERMGAGEYVMALIRRPRNLGHHRKFFALAHLAFEYWKPTHRTLEGIPATKSFDRFRKDLIIAAGHYQVVLGLDGEPRLEAESIAFDNMGQEKFNELYDSVVNVLTTGILHGMTKRQAEALAEQVQQEGF